MTCPICGMYPYQHPNDSCRFPDSESVRREFEAIEEDAMRETGDERDPEDIP